MEPLLKEYEELSLGEMYEEYFPKIYNMIYFRILSKEQTEDLVSEVFLKVAKNFDLFDARKASFKTWIYTIANNALIDYYRLKKESVSIDALTQEPRTDAHHELSLIQSENRKVLLKALKTLDERTRAIISLKYFAEMSIKEIAAELHINESTASTLHIRGLERLRKVLKENFFVF